jgi:hypothetical protein
MVMCILHSEEINAIVQRLYSGGKKEGQKGSIMILYLHCMSMSTFCWAPCHWTSPWARHVHPSQCAVLRLLPDLRNPTQSAHELVLIISTSMLTNLMRIMDGDAELASKLPDQSRVLLEPPADEDDISPLLIEHLL